MAVNEGTELSPEEVLFGWGVPTSQVPSSRPLSIIPLKEQAASIPVSVSLQHRSLPDLSFCSSLQHFMESVTKPCEVHGKGEDGSTCPHLPSGGSGQADINMQGLDSSQPIKIFPWDKTKQNNKNLINVQLVPFGGNTGVSICTHTYTPMHTQYTYIHVHTYSLQSSAHEKSIC